jgi:hypothetical protein
MVISLPLFPAGQIVATPGALALLEHLETGELSMNSLPTIPCRTAAKERLHQ